MRILMASAVAVFLMAGPAAAIVGGPSTPGGGDPVPAGVNPSAVEVPTPGTLALLAAGVIAIGFARRR